MTWKNRILKGEEDLRKYKSEHGKETMHLDGSLVHQLSVRGKITPHIPSHPPHPLIHRFGDGDPHTYFRFRILSWSTRKSVGMARPVIGITSGLISEFQTREWPDDAFWSARLRQ